MTYPNVESQPNLPLLEQGVQAFWEADRTFEASIAARPAGSAPGLTDNEYIFYDGPPFANGLPHYGHLLTGYVKDAVRSGVKEAFHRAFPDADRSFPARTMFYFSNEPQPGNESKLVDMKQAPEWR